LLVLCERSWIALPTVVKNSLRESSYEEGTRKGRRKMRHHTVTVAVTFASINFLPPWNDLFIVMGLVSDSGWALTAGSAAGWLRRNQGFMRSQRYVTGTVYLGLSMATAVSGSRHK
jgi:hypothetical protein